MIKINDRFSIDREPDCWVLYDTKPSTNPRSTTGVKTDKSWYPRLGHVVNEVFNRCPEGAESLKEVHDRMVQLREDVYRAIMGGPCRNP